MSDPKPPPPFVAQLPNQCQDINRVDELLFLGKLPQQCLAILDSNLMRYMCGDTDKWNKFFAFKTKDTIEYIINYMQFLADNKLTHDEACERKKQGQKGYGPSMLTFVTLGESKHAYLLDKKGVSDKVFHKAISYFDPFAVGTSDSSDKANRFESKRQAFKDHNWSSKTRASRAHRTKAERSSNNANARQTMTTEARLQGMTTEALKAELAKRDAVLVEEHAAQKAEAAKELCSRLREAETKVDDINVESFVDVDLELGIDCHRMEVMKEATHKTKNQMHEKLKLILANAGNATDVKACAGEALACAEEALVRAEKERKDIINECRVSTIATRILDLRRTQMEKGYEALNEQAALQAAEDKQKFENAMKHIDSQNGTFKEWREVFKDLKKQYDRQVEQAKILKKASEISHISLQDHKWHPLLHSIKRHFAIDKLGEEVAKKAGLQSRSDESALCSRMGKVNLGSNEQKMKKSGCDSLKSGDSWESSDDNGAFIPLNIQYEPKADNDESTFVSHLTSHTFVSKATGTPAGNDQDHAPSQAGRYPAAVFGHGEHFGPFSMNHGGMPPTFRWPYQYQNNVALFGNDGVQQMNGVQQQHFGGMNGQFGIIHGVPFGVMHGVPQQQFPTQQQRQQHGVQQHGVVPPSPSFGSSSAGRQQNGGQQNGGQQNGD